ncbi:hypothetical protein DYB37_011886 [Aphanomyces astaci]|nr:hypothetical protein DYB25_013804 [Aphanomyces astaci]RHY37875.1 hypothetical protein DYB34_014183 [Aphanomyces astaci]RHY83558.1 hypothetical protein DYB26_007616 [Aphanomyces astaci]RHZ00608.1 hypothetical protein DYB35_012166 [Aphanomyces astaci]RHZ30556.1 hypothetical protein DYB37_011886 [Aphanomyces astaci]
METSDAVATAKHSVVRSGLVFTKGQHEDGLFGRGTWKLRYVELTTDNVLQYYAAKGGSFTGQVDLAQCYGMEVMPLDCPQSGNRLTSVYRIAIKTTTKRRIVIAALSEQGMNAWVAALHSAVGPSLKAKSPKTSGSRFSIFRRVLRTL